jgi:hypothetical protein
MIWFKNFDLENSHEILKEWHLDLSDCRTDLRNHCLLYVDEDVQTDRRKYIGKTLPLMTTGDALIYTRCFSFKFTNFHFLEQTDAKLCPMTNIDIAIKMRGEYSDISIIENQYGRTERKSICPPTKLAGHKN